MLTQRWTGEDTSHRNSPPFPLLPNHCPVDWLVGGYIINGASKFGIVQRDDLDWDQTHGSTKDYKVFEELEDLKYVNYQQNMDLTGKIYYTQKLKTPNNGTIFYQIGPYILKY